jgi:rod shape-determining protein MreC
VQRPDSRAKGSLAGIPEINGLELLYTPRLADIRVGDLLISSGYGLVFKKGWPAGKVKKISSDPDSLYPKIMVEPVADFTKLEEVIVIVPEDEGRQ